jgi:hypothetical protein
MQGLEQAEDRCDRTSLSGSMIQDSSRTSELLAESGYLCTSRAKAGQNGLVFPIKLPKVSFRDDTPKGILMNSGLGY